MRKLLLLVVLLFCVGVIASTQAASDRVDRMVRIDDILARATVVRNTEKL